MLIAFLILFAIAIYCITSVEEPARFTEVKEMYTLFIEHMRVHNTDPRYEALKHRCVLVGFDKKKGDLGYNTNKGYEIGLCLDGTPNQIFHVLLHELAHSTVSEYEHSKQFWDNFRELKRIATDAGIYKLIPHKVGFCGQHIQDL
tara:strand:+ start:74 stop:508 length:435 start_codon:yes stop_codon:yes gene_type:complete